MMFVPPSSVHGPPRMSAAERVGVLFDLDGTLIDSIELILCAAEHAFAGRIGRAPTREEFRSGIGTPLASQFGPYCTNDDDLQLLIGRYREFQLAHHDRLTSCYAGIVDAVRVLRENGDALAVVTSKVNAMAMRALRYVGLADAFPVVIGCDATTRHKPEAEPVLLALERLAVEPGRAIFFGDSPYDILAGRAAGVTSVAVVWGAFSREALEEAGAHATLANPAEIPAFVERFRREKRPS